MDNRKIEFSAYIGMAIFIAFFVLMLSSFSESSITQTREPVKLEQALEYLSTNTNSIIVKVVHIPVYRQQWISCIDQLNLNTINESFKIRHDNARVNHKKIVVQNLAYSIKPILLFNHFVYLMSEKSDYVPILS